MSTGGTDHAVVPFRRGGLILIICSCLATTLSLVAREASFLDRWVSTGGGEPGQSSAFTPPDRFLVMAAAGALAVVVGLLVIRFIPRDAWPWLLVAGTALTAALLLPDVTATMGNLDDDVWLVAALGAGPALVVIGLLGAGNWLGRAVSPGIGAVVAGAALAAPLLGGAVLGLFVPALREFDFWPLRTLHVVLIGVSVAGAICTAVMLPRLPREPGPERPATLVTVAGVIAGLVPVVPHVATVVARPDPAANPSDALRVSIDDWSRVFGLGGLMVLGVAVALAFVLGSRVLGAALAVGFVLFGVGEVMLHIGGAVTSPVLTLILVLAGFALGGLAAATRWRTWFAAATCSGLGIATIVMASGGRRPPEALAAVLLPLVVVAAVTTVASAAVKLATGTRIPAVIGAIAVAMQVGLVDSAALLTLNGVAGYSRWSYDGVILAAGTALLLAAGLVVALRVARAAPPAGAEPPDQPAPALTPG